MVVSNGVHQSAKPSGSVRALLRGAGGAFEVLFEGIEALGPLGSVRLEPGIQLLERLGAEAVEPPLSVTPDLDQPSVTQHLQMPRNAGMLHADVVDEVANRALALADGIKDASTGRLGDGFEDGGVGHEGQVSGTGGMER